MLGPRLFRLLPPPAHSDPTVQMTITHQGAVAHLVEEEGAGASIPLVDWFSEKEPQMNWLKDSPGQEPELSHRVQNITS